MTPEQKRGYLKAARDAHVNNAIADAVKAEQRTGRSAAKQVEQIAEPEVKVPAKK